MASPSAAGEARSRGERSREQGGDGDAMQDAERDERRREDRVARGRRRECARRDDGDAAGEGGPAARSPARRAPATRRPAAGTTTRCRTCAEPERVVLEVRAQQPEKAQVEGEVVGDHRQQCQPPRGVDCRDAASRGMMPRPGDRPAWRRFARRGRAISGSEARRAIASRRSRPAGPATGAVRPARPAAGRGRGRVSAPARSTLELAVARARRLHGPAPGRASVRRRRQASTLAVPRSSGTPPGSASRARRHSARTVPRGVPSTHVASGARTRSSPPARTPAGRAKAVGRERGLEVAHCQRIGAVAITWPRIAGQGSTGSRSRRSSPRSSGNGSRRHATGR